MIYIYNSYIQYYLFYHHLCIASYELKKNMLKIKENGIFTFLTTSNIKIVNVGQGTVSCFPLIPIMIND